MSIGTLIRRLLVYRLIQYRIAWAIFSCLGFYLAGTVFLIVSAQQQLRLQGSFQSCAKQHEGTFIFALQSQPGQQFLVSPMQFTPRLPTDFCQQAQIAMLYETDYFRDPPIVDAVSLTNTQAGTVKYYAQNERIGFSTSHHLQLVLDGSLFFMSIVMLLVAIFWRRVGYLVQRHPRRNSNIPTAFVAQVEEDVRWLESLPWGIAPAPDAQKSMLRFKRGLTLVRGWLGDETRLLDGVELLVGCPPALAYAGAAEVALQCSALDAAHYLSQGVSYALRMIERALAQDPTSIEARLTYVQVLAAVSTANHQKNQSTLQQAEQALIALHREAPTHSRLPLAVAAVYLAQHRYKPAIEALRTALQLAPSQEDANAILDLLAQTLLLSGNLQQALRLFVQLNMDGDGTLVRLPAAQRRLAQVRTH